ncbi:MAG TPA: class I SAM-dependent methyltransferase [Methylomirabilota bacterium]|nr:class I SAM-dependent methyltransferase [Methylomirabilota bacterium]
MGPAVTAARRRRAPYAAPLYYHVAFELNRKAETEFLVAAFRRYATGRVRHVLDVACGTGHHSLRLARRGYRVTALDLSRPSIAFLRDEAARAGLDVTALVGDMTAFRLPARVDAAICMQDSQGHLLTTPALIAHLRAVRGALRPGGVYVFDRLVPNGWKPGARWTWTRRRRGITVQTTFQTLLDYDVARQVCQEVMRFDVTENGHRRTLTQRHATRIVFPQELRAIVALAGGFEFCAWFSNFSFRRPLERSAAALVMVVVLRAT